MNRFIGVKDSALGTRYFNLSRMIGWSLNESEDILMVIMDHPVFDNEEGDDSFIYFYKKRSPAFGELVKFLEDNSVLLD